MKIGDLVKLNGFANSGPTGHDGLLICLSRTGWWEVLLFGGIIVQWPPSHIEVINENW